VPVDCDMSTPIARIPSVVEDLRRCFRKKTRGLSERKKQLRSVLRLIQVSYEKHANRRAGVLTTTYKNRKTNRISQQH